MFCVPLFFGFCSFSFPCKTNHSPWDETKKTHKTTWSIKRVNVLLFPLNESFAVHSNKKIIIFPLFPSLFINNNIQKNQSIIGVGCFIAMKKHSDKIQVNKSSSLFALLPLNDSFRIDSKQSESTNTIRKNRSLFQFCLSFSRWMTHFPLIPTTNSFHQVNQTTLKQKSSNYFLACFCFFPVEWLIPRWFHPVAINKQSTKQVDL